MRFAAALGLLTACLLLASCEDPAGVNDALKAEKKKCETCRLDATTKHKCGTTAYCEKCLGDATKEKKVSAESAYEVDKTTHVAKCKACGSMLGVTK